MSLPTCRVCDAPAVAFAPGSEPEMSDGGVMIVRDAPACGWCLEHWPTLRGHQAGLFDRIGNTSSAIQEMTR